jgi:hypothetical protein
MVMPCLAMALAAFCSASAKGLWVETDASGVLFFGAKRSMGRSSKNFPDNHPEVRPKPVQRPFLR